jgi:hypothetical protein
MSGLFLVVLSGVGVAEGAQALAGAAGLDVEQVAAQEVDVPVLERGEPGDVLVLDGVALGAEPGNSSVDPAENLIRPGGRQCGGVPGTAGT